MRKRVLSAILCISMICISLVGCQSGDKAEKTEKKEKDVPVVRVACTPYSGQILDAIAQGKGFYEDEGVEVELYFTHYPSDAQAAMLAGHCDILSTFGTPAPLQAISSGDEFTVFAGYMLEGATAYIGREGETVNSVEDILGKTFIGSPESTYLISNALLDAGYDPHKDVKWVQSGGDMSANLEMIRKEVADFSGSTTGYFTTAKEIGLTDVFYPDDFYPEYSCCRVYAETDWLKENEDAVVRVLTAWMRAQEVLETDPDYAIEQVEKQTELTKEYIEAFIKSEHFMIRLDPHWKAVSTAWNQLDRVGGLPGETDIECMKEHFNCSMYKEALDTCVEKYYDENPEFYDYYLKYYEEVNVDFLK